jgi:hypothetical protein
MYAAMLCCRRCYMSVDSPVYNLWMDVGFLRLMPEFRRSLGRFAYPLPLASVHVARRARKYSSATQVIRTAKR